VDAKERLTFEEATAPTLLASTHRHRYELAAELCTGLRVVDVGCGSGYGGAILARTCRAVVGVDREEQTIAQARSELGGTGGLDFEVADAREFLRDRLRDRFDAIVMFEVLEHLEDADDVLVSLRRQADDGLKLILSVPNSRMLDEENPFHVRDFGYDEAREVAERLGGRMLSQYIAEGSLIRGDDEGEPVLSLAEEGEPEYANQFLLLVNVDGGDATVSALMRLESDAINVRYLRGLERANEELRVANVRLAREKLGAADSAAASLAARVRALEKELAGARLLEHKEWIDDLHRQIEEGRETISMMEASRAWRVGRSYWALRDRLRRLTGRS
jgi:2-polyprenyl-3-methyl-5-hydroxy-6-metoxy-1,4-benzoquinol methylase